MTRDDKQIDDVASATSAILEAMQQLTEQSINVGRQIGARQNAAEFLLDGLFYAIVSTMSEHDRRQWFDSMHALAIEPVIALNTAKFASEREQVDVRATVHMTHTAITAILDRLASRLPSGHQARRGN